MLKYVIKSLIRGLNFELRKIIHARGRSELCAYMGTVVGGRPPGPFDPYPTPQGLINFIGTYNVSINHKFHIETFDILNL